METERFEILEGTMTFKLGRKTIVAKAGDVVTLPAGKKRKITNGGFTTAQVLVQITPSDRSK